MDLEERGRAEAGESEGWQPLRNGQEARLRSRTIRKDLPVCRTHTHTHTHTHTPTHPHTHTAHTHRILLLFERYELRFIKFYTETALKAK